MCCHRLASQPAGLPARAGALEDGVPPGVLALGAGVPPEGGAAGDEETVEHPAVSPAVVTAAAVRIAFRHPVYLLQRLMTALCLGCRSRAGAPGRDGGGSQR